MSDESGEQPLILSGSQQSLAEVGSVQEVF